MEREASCHNPTTRNLKLMAARVEDQFLPAFIILPAALRLTCQSESASETAIASPWKAY